MSSKAVKGLILLGIFIFFIVVLIIPSWNNVVQTDREEKEAMDKYIMVIEEVYGPDRSQWPECVLKTIEYSNTHPFIRIIQHGGTAVPDFCGTR